MKLESQVASLELCKKLKELGVKQESYFWWCLDMFDSSTVGGKYNLENWNQQYADGHEPENAYISAFNVAELGEMLPDEYQMMKVEDAYVGCKIEWFHGNVICKVIENKGLLSDTEADARAKMLIYLLENKLL